MNRQPNRAPGQREPTQWSGRSMPPPSRPDYRPLPHDDRPPWEIPTPTSRRRMQGQKQEQHQEHEQARVQARKRIRTEPNAEELAEARRRHDAGLVRTAEQQAAYRAGHNLLAATGPKSHSNRTPERFGVRKAESIATRWASRV